MIKYKEISKEYLDQKLIDDIYKELLEEKWQFIIIEVKGVNYVLTKEKSLFEISDKEKFIKEANEDIYYHTEIKKRNDVLDEALDKFKAYINKYRKYLEKDLYGDKYIFGSVAVRLDDESFITTIRGKEDLSEYTVVSKLDDRNKLVIVEGKKATLNAPLLANLFKNKKVDVIVHINHYFDDKLPYYEYAFPGTVKDSTRNNETSFNIQYHGVMYLLDEEGNRL